MARIRSWLGLLYHNRPAFAKRRKRFAEKRNVIFPPDCPSQTKKRQFSFTSDIWCYIMTSNGKYHSRCVAMTNHQADDSFLSLRKAMLSILLRDILQRVLCPWYNFNRNTNSGMFVYREVDCHECRRCLTLPKKAVVRISFQCGNFGEISFSQRRKCVSDCSGKQASSSGWFYGTNKSFR